MMTWLGGHTCCRFSQSQRRLWLVVAWAVLLSASAVAAQSDYREVTRDAGSGCSGLSLVGPTVDIGEPSAAVLLDYYTSIVPADGGFIAAPTTSPGLIAIFDSAGSFVRSVGHEGAGPGEFRHPRVFAGPDGTVWIYDATLGRLTRFDDGVLGESERIRGGFGSTAPFQDSLVAVIGSFRGDDGSIRPFHVLDRTARPTVSFGAWRNRAVEGTITAADEAIWTAFINEFTVEQWSPVGELKATYRRDAQWFEDYETLTPESPKLLRIHADAPGRVWVFVLVAGGPSATATEPPRGLGDRDERYDTVIEVWDVTQGRVVGCKRLDSAVARPLPGRDEVLVAVEDASGYVSFEVYRIAITP